jgi:hypothetical protein
MQAEQVANHEGNQLNPQLSVEWQPYSGNSIQLALNNTLKSCYFYDSEHVVV